MLPHKCAFGQWSGIWAEYVAVSHAPVKFRVGTGIDSATQRMLNGLALDNLGGDPATFTFSNVSNGTYSLIVHVTPPLQFQEVNYKGNVANCDFDPRTLDHRGTPSPVTEAISGEVKFYRTISP